MYRLLTSIYTCSCQYISPYWGQQWWMDQRNKEKISRNVDSSLWGRNRAIICTIFPFLAYSILRNISLYVCCHVSKSTNENFLQKHFILIILKEIFIIWNNVMENVRWNNSVNYVIYVKSIIWNMVHIFNSSNSDASSRNLNQTRHNRYFHIF